MDGSALRGVLKTFGDGFKCTVCLDHFTNPMMLPCTHSICAECAGNWLSNKQECPVCKSKVCFNICARGHIDVGTLSPHNLNDEKH